MMRDTRTEETLNTSQEDLDAIAEYKLTDPDHLYKHCMGCGVIFSDDYETKLIDVYKLCGLKNLPFKMGLYKITTGACSPCQKIMTGTLDTIVAKYEKVQK